MNIREFFNFGWNRRPRTTSEILTSGCLYNTWKSRAINSSREALTLPAVYRCVDILAGTIASMSLELSKNDGRGLYEVLTTGSLPRIFNGRANSRQTFYDLMYNAVSERYLQGNAYIYAKRSRGAVDGLDTVEFWLLHGVSYDAKRNVYQVHDDIYDIHGIVEASDIIHIRNRGYDGYTGESTISFACRTLTLSAIADEQTMDGLAEGNKQKGFLTGGDPTAGLGSIADSFQDSVASRLEQELTAGKSVIRLPGSLDFRPLSITPSDAQLLETRKFSPVDICRFFGVHPDLVFVDGTSNYKASENAQITFLQQTLAPVLRQISAEFTTKLITGRMRDKYRITYNTDSIYLTDSVSRAEYYKRSIESGVLTPNEVRKKEGLPPVENGDTAFVSCNVYPLKDVDNRTMLNDKTLPE